MKTLTEIKNCLLSICTKNDFPKSIVTELENVQNDNQLETAIISMQKQANDNSEIMREIQICHNSYSGK